MMENKKKYIIESAEDEVLNIEKKHIEQYLSEVKEAVGNDRYRLDRNAKRQDNINLFLDYIIDEAKAKDIIMGLTVMDFSEILQNKHKGFEHERLYVFGKDVTLLERNGTEEKIVSLYIKFNKLENCFVIVISFHEQKHPLTYYFK
nr:hypothetical protein [uncultured Marvinbryantia sp.]